MSVFLGVDLGTTNIKSVLTSDSGEILGVHREHVVYDRDEDGKCELPAGRFEEALHGCFRGVCAIAGVEAREIRGVSYASQANSVLILDAAGNPLTPIISWQDDHIKRVAPSVEEWWALEGFLDITGLGIKSNQFAVAKLVELQGEPVWKSAGSVMTISDYFIFLLSGGRIGDESTAAMLGIYDIRRHDWWSDALSVLRIDRDLLVEPRTPGSPAGTVGSDGARRFGLLEGTPVFVGGLDHYIAAVGAGADTLADASESTGTVVACVFTGSHVKPLPGACLGPGMRGYYLLVFDDYGGTVLEKYRAETCPDRSFAELDALAAKTPPGAGGISAELGSGGTLRFVTNDRTETEDERIGREARAVLELTASMLGGLMHRGSADAPPRVVSTGGGARSAIWTRIKSSMIGSTFYTVSSEEPAAHGAAFLAARGAGMVAGVEDPSALVGMPESWISVRSVTQPDPGDSEFYSEWVRNRKAW